VQKITDQWITRSTTHNASDHLLNRLLFDDAGHRMVPTHATKPVFAADEERLTE
jgi:site-specific DNA recombinase